MIFGLILSVVFALALLVVFNEERSSYVVVLLTAVVGFLLLRALERNSREVRTASRKLRDHQAGLGALSIRIEQHGLILSNLRKDQHSNELRIRRLNDFSKNSTASVAEIKLSTQTTAELLKKAQITLFEMKRMFDRFDSEQYSNEKRLSLLNNSIKEIKDDATKIRTDGHSNELRLRRLVESVGSLVNEAQKSATNQHSNELRLRRLVEMTHRIEASIIQFTYDVNKQNEVQYKSDALVKYQILDDLLLIRNSIVDTSGN